jgi:hypothetical protein
MCLILRYQFITSFFTMKKYLILVFSTIACFEVMAAPPPQPVMKIGGSCPTGYSVSGGSYCTPSGNARFAIIRLGSSCPSGYISSGGGNYCLAASDNAKTAIPKAGSSCPNGYSTSGSNYCLSDK